MSESDYANALAVAAQEPDQVAVPRNSVEFLIQEYLLLTWVAEI